MRIARHIEITREGVCGRLTIDGEPFPWDVDRMINVETIVDGMTYVTVRILVNEGVTIRDMPHTYS